MSKKKLYKFEPDYTVSPGAVLDDALESLDMKKGDFAQRCGLSSKTISQILHGKAPITPESAIVFESILGIPASTWLNLENMYRLEKAKSANIEELKQSVSELKRFPIKELMQGGFISKSTEKVDTARDILRFFSVGSFDALNKRINLHGASYRHSPSFESPPEVLSSWVRAGVVSGEDIETELYNKTRFAKALDKIRNITRKKADEYVALIVSHCAEAGVAVVLMPEFKKTHISGATKWITQDKALIILSLRHKTDDHFWFSFFHEAGHILLHSKKAVFIDDKKYENIEETQANVFASDMLISPDDYSTFTSKGIFTRESIQRFSKEINIASGIVVGRLQFDGFIKYNSPLSTLKRKLAFT